MTNHRKMQVSKISQTKLWNADRELRSHAELGTKPRHNWNELQLDPSGVKALLSYLKEKRATMSRRKERRTSPPPQYNCCSPESESNMRTMGVCELQERLQLVVTALNKDCAVDHYWCPTVNAESTHQIEWECFCALAAQSHLQQLLGQRT